MNTPLIPYSRQEITENDIAAVIAVLRSDFLTQGTQVPAFERAMAERHEVAHAVAMGNATQGLHLACLALGVGPGSRVWTSPNSFVASANCALYCGASVDFVDIDPKTRNLSVAALRAKLVAARACATLPHLVIPVDFAGLPADLREMRELADEFDFKILEDASHATGSSYLGKPVGSRWADATVFSFHAVKVITTAEGGMVTTQDAALAERLRDLRSHGVTRDPYRLCQPSEGEWVYEQHSLGFNARMTELQAALGLSQLRRLESMHARRTALAARYKVLLAGLPLGLPEEFADRTSAWPLSNHTSRRNSQTYRGILCPAGCRHRRQRALHPHTYAAVLSAERLQTGRLSGSRAILCQCYFVTFTPHSDDRPTGSSGGCRSTCTRPH
jgi:dTDP-4-amino-4,6-dideoxygalactose transaminase